MPGLGGTQRLGRALGKFKVDAALTTQITICTLALISDQAMEMILTSSTMTGEELHQRGLVSAVFEADEVLSGALACAEKIASFSTPVVQLAKQSILNGTSSKPQINMCSISASISPASSKQFKALS